MNVPSQNSHSTKSITMHEEIVEVARLRNKTLLLLQALGGLLPGLQAEHTQHLTTVLDIACGPGVWTAELARAHPHMQITDIDTSTMMINHARTTSREQALRNVAYLQIPSFVNPLPFEETSFDLISMQFMEKFLKKDDWPFLLSECWRVLRPSGLLRLTELEIGLPNSLHKKNSASYFFMQCVWMAEASRPQIGISV